MSKKEVVGKLKESEREIVKLSNELGQEWYIINERNPAVADEIIKEMVSQKGWIFKQKEGSGLFFERHGENLIVETQMWTSDFTLVEIPVNFNE